MHIVKGLPSFKPSEIKISQNCPMPTSVFATRIFAKIQRLFSTSPISLLNFPVKDCQKSLIDTSVRIKMLTQKDHALFFSGDKVLTRKGKNPFIIPCHRVYTDPNKMPNEKDYLLIDEHEGKKIYTASYEQPINNNDNLLLIPARDALAMTDQKTSQLIRRAKHLLNWHRSSLYSGCCGIPTKLSQHEIAKICQDCKRVIYPTTSSVVIILIEKDGNILLARSPHFAKGMYSTLAGFVDAGESYEEAVHREVHEEVGIKVKDITYFGSQSWPFPASITVAYRAKYAEGEIYTDPKEIEDAQWFDPKNLPCLPHPCSISRHIIDTYIK